MLHHANGLVGLASAAPFCGEGFLNLHSEARGGRSKISDFTQNALLSNNFPDTRLPRSIGSDGRWTLFVVLLIGRDSRPISGCGLDSFF